MKENIHVPSNDVRSFTGVCKQQTSNTLLIIIHKSLDVIWLKVIKFINVVQLKSWRQSF